MLPPSRRRADRRTSNSLGDLQMFNFGSKRRQATTIAAALGVLAFGGVLASAASLGTISGNTLGVGVAAVGTCDNNGVTVAYNNTFDNTAGTYQVTGVADRWHQRRRRNLCRQTARRDPERPERRRNRHRSAVRWRTHRERRHHRPMPTPKTSSAWPSSSLTTKRRATALWVGSRSSWTVIPAEEEQTIRAGGGSAF